MTAYLDLDEIENLCAARGAHTVLPDVVAEVGRLQEIIEGRHAPPTTEEIVAHIEACGSWLIGSRGGYNVLESDLERLQEFADRCRRMNLSWRWVAINVSGAPCEWPTVSPSITPEKP